MCLISTIFLVHSSLPLSTEIHQWMHHTETAMPVMEAPIFSHPDLPGVTIRPLGSQQPVRGIQQSVLVTVERNGTIPLHSHEVDADMGIVSGTAIILSDDEDNGREVGVGHCVRFRAGGKHGFRVGPEGLTFVSTNGGIIDRSPDQWDITF